MNQSKFPYFKALRDFRPKSLLSEADVDLRYHWYLPASRLDSYELAFIAVFTPQELAAKIQSHPTMRMFEILEHQESIYKLVWLVPRWVCQETELLGVSFRKATNKHGDWYALVKPIDDINNIFGATK